MTGSVRLYDRLFTQEFPGQRTGDFLDDINEDSVKVIENCKFEPSLRDARPGEYLQFLRTGYFCADSRDFTSESPVFNRTIPLKDSWEKLKKKMGI